ncbi:MAG: hypothetical protein KGZ65_04055 [Sphingomonadales bacterium]|nr:hypothetical protein [Sphingomonadaceae bacterium]MBS3930386.1 hypothetical protein [Sphingomonadales bacterium]
MTHRQEVLKDVLPPLTPLQEAARIYLEAEQEAANLKTRAGKRKEEMITMANRIGEDFVKVRDEDGFMHTFAFESKAAVRHSKLLDVKVVKHDSAADA